MFLLIVSGIKIYVKNMIKQSNTEQSYIEIPDKFYILSQILYIPLCYIDKILTNFLKIFI